MHEQEMRREVPRMIRECRLKYGGIGRSGFGFELRRRHLLHHHFPHPPKTGKGQVDSTSGPR